jgi:NAD(P)H-hydrate epimerase
MRLPAQLLQRPSDSHKRNYGHILILAGSRGLTGAAVLCSQAAMRSGAGLVTLGIPSSLNNIMEINLIEVMTLPLAETSEGSLSLRAGSKIKKIIKKIDILVIGPGLSLNKSTQALVRGLIFSSEKPIVVDADGLNALVGHLDDLKCQTKRLKSVRILTPHPGELSRLINRRTEIIQKNRKKFAVDFAKKNNSIVVLKGYRTVVASPDYVYINKTGNAGMATAGSGDVLTGIIASFLAQGLEASQAAKFAVYIHGLAGDLAVRKFGKLGLTASDIIDYIPKAIKSSS